MIPDSPQRPLLLWKSIVLIAGLNPAQEVWPFVRSIVLIAGLNPAQEVWPFVVGSAQKVWPSVRSVVLLAGSSHTQKVCPSVVIHRFNQGSEARVEGLSFCGGIRAKGLALCAFRRFIHRFAHTKGLSFCGNPSFYSQVCAHKRSVLLWQSIVFIRGQRRAQKVWPSVVIHRFTRRFEPHTKGLAFCGNPSFSSEVRGARKRSGLLW